MFYELIHDILKNVYRTGVFIGKPNGKKVVPVFEIFWTRYKSLKELMAAKLIVFFKIPGTDLFCHLIENTFSIQKDSCL